MYIKYIIALFVLFLIIESCTKQIKIDFPDQEQKLVLNSLFTNDSVFKIRLSKTTDFTHSTTEFISNAEINLYQSNIFISEFECTEKGLYKSVNNYKPILNKDYSVHVTHKDFPELYAVNQIPENPVIIQINKQDSVLIDEEGYYLSEVKILLDDETEKTNFYEIALIGYYFKDYSNIPGYENFQSEDTVWQKRNLFLNCKNDLVLVNEGLADYYPKAYPFSDILFNGEQYLLKFNYLPPQDILFENNTEYNLAGKYKLIVIIRSVSKEYYKYRKKLIVHLENQSGDIWDGMANPIQMYSNIEGGYGIFAGYSAFIDTIP